MLGYPHDYAFRSAEAAWLEPPDGPDDLIECPDCKGEGQFLVGLDEMAECETCDGTGEIEPEPYEEDPDDARDRWLDQQREDREMGL